MERELTCINCPLGCRLVATLNDAGTEVLSVTGNTCPRGDKYARQECTLPERMITAVIPAEGSETPLSVKTANPVPKSMISAIMEELSRVRVSVPVHTGDVVLANVLDTGVDVIATRDL